MKIKKSKDKSYLLLKLSTRDRKYLEGLLKHESAKSIKSFDKYLNDMIAQHVKAVFIMQVGLMLESQGVVSSSVIAKVFSDLDSKLDAYNKLIDKYFRQLKKRIK